MLHIHAALQYCETVAIKKFAAYYMQRGWTYYKIEICSYILGYRARKGFVKEKYYYKYQSPSQLLFFTILITENIE